MPSEIATPSPVSLDRSAAVVDAPTLAAPQAVVKKSTKSHLVSGFISGLTSSVLLQPLDLLKTRVQQSKSTTLTSAIRDLDSVRSLWRGTLPSAIRTSVGSALYLTTLNATRTYVARYSAKTGGNTNTSSSALPKLSMQGNLLSGAIVRGAVGIITMPVTVVKVRYESSMYKYNSMLHGITDIYSNHGVAGFFKGWGVTFLRDAPHAGLYVLFYEKSKDMLCLLLGDKKTSANRDSNMLNTSMSAVVNSTSAVLSAGMATTITGPFDTMKTRVQLDPVKYNSVATTVRIILQEEGIKGLFDGLSLRLARKAMSAGISWCIYEELIRRF
ncbi:hypothetical protein DV495_002362 [Geotrichum candidum]|uniref:Mitochondrial glycine transporter n=1 Tax=Geotrichum candidum TaxID=1173061 RepID=A0A0J9XH54_GEOCN|nr:hypothetical protein DV452_001372 [Geotrichum candidum]KAI9213486.1 hypothetical protein DS838_001659 [Geotrichum bryndzae]KAF5129328.1 hypothetical protein DV495_002362 [Geotrichum candidum]KAF7498553.1 hypothetical protein DV113_003447 [Geotrichum candidum]KAI8133409.1 hypothetical protein DUD61_002948 [Geotrichum candidum]